MKITAGKHERIVSGNNTPWALKLQKGFLIGSQAQAVFYSGSDTGGGHKYALNGGVQLKDGMVILGSFITRAKSKKECLWPVWKSGDGGQTFTGPIDVTVSDIPGLSGNYDDSGAWNDSSLWFHRSIIELPNGELLASMYGNLQSDTAKANLPQFDFPMYRYRTIIIKSIDSGTTWRYFSTVAYDPSIGDEGFCEPCLVYLPDNEILCMMRTDGAGTAMYQAWSKDDGQSWSKPISTNVPGVDPDLLLLDNGILACSYGRPGNNIMFSMDNGRTWTNQTGIFDGPSTHYTAMIKTGPNKILVLYHRAQLNQWAGDTYGVDITVEK